MIIFLYGKDSYRRQEKRREILSQYKAKNADADMLALDLEEAPEDWKRAGEFLRQQSLFVSSKAVLITGSSEISEDDGFNKKEVKEWISILTSALSLPKTFIIISQESAPKVAFKFLLAEPVLVQEFQKISLASFEQPISLSDVQKILAFNAYDESFAIALQLLRARDVSGRLLALSLLLFRGDEARYTFNLLGSLARGREAVLLAEYDEKIKGGEMDDETSLLGFALGV